MVHTLYVCCIFHNLVLVALDGQNPSVAEEVGSVEICIVVIQGAITTESRVILNSIGLSATCESILSGLKHSNVV